MRHPLEGPPAPRAGGLPASSPKGSWLRLRRAHHWAPGPLARHRDHRRSGARHPSVLGREPTLALSQKQNKNPNENPNHEKENGKFQISFRTLACPFGGWAVWGGNQGGPPGGDSRPRTVRESVGTPRRTRCVSAALLTSDRQPNLPRLLRPTGKARPAPLLGSEPEGPTPIGPQAQVWSLEGLLARLASTCTAPALRT